MKKKLSTVKMDGKGLSFADAVTMTDSGELKLLTNDYSRYREGTLMMRIIKGKVVPFIKFTKDGQVHFHLCVAFQTKGVDGKYCNLNLSTLTSALSYSIRMEGEEQDE